MKKSPLTTWTFDSFGPLAFGITFFFPKIFSLKTTNFVVKTIGVH